MTREAIAYVTSYSHPSKDSIERMLRETFPEFCVDVISIEAIVRERRRWLVPNLLYAMKTSGARVVSRTESLRTAYWRSPYLFRKVKSVMPDFISPTRHAFSIQTQSIYDASVLGVPHFVYTDHTHLSNLASQFFDRRQLRSSEWISLERSLYHNAATVFTRSNHVSVDLVEHYGVPPEKIVCAGFGTNVRVRPNAQLNNDGYSNKQILFVGGDWERKGGPELMRAFEQVLARHPAARLLIAGAEPKHVLPNCAVLGHVPLEQLPDLYGRCSVFCVPTRLEPFGVVFLEAMMHKLPVVATRIAAIPDMVRDRVTGLLVEPGDSEALAAALNCLLDDPPLCRDYGERGFEHAIRTYTWERVGARVRTRVCSIVPEVAGTS
jgi:glycosyltransferase involved in cell wall biosynthesis